ncbi:hypothetical protein MK079_03150 [Candidatus Gracilibacteria bacterium]|nr:hypothetical protein [Candidatus Gracilibacteria bacterium]
MSFDTLPTNSGNRVAETAWEHKTGLEKEALISQAKDLEPYIFKDQLTSFNNYINTIVQLDPKDATEQFDIIRKNIISQSTTARKHNFSAVQSAANDDLDQAA